MTRLPLILTLFLLCMTASPFAAMADNYTWEPAKKELSQGGKSVVKDPDIEIIALKDGIVITTSKTIPVKVFTILGRLVSSKTIEPGTMKLPIAVHGVYIVAVADKTCKIAI